VIVTNHTVTIAAELVNRISVSFRERRLKVFFKEDGSKLVGQCEISHPLQQELAPITFTLSDPSSPVDGMGEVISQGHNVMFEQGAKSEYHALESRIFRRCQDSKGFPMLSLVLGLFYINAYGIEIHPLPNPDYLSSLTSKDVLVYSCGSLWTR
jgi:hypothetical protein